MIIKSLSSLSEAELTSCITCYQAVFAGEPWNEWKTCRICGKKWGLGAEAELTSLGGSHCGVPVELFWPTHVVEQDLRQMAERHLDASLVALNDAEVIGFGLGYGIAAEELEAHLGITMIPQLARLSVLSTRVVAYQDDLGVLQAFRTQGIARQLFGQRLKTFISLGLETGVVRTLQDPPSVTYDWYLRLGYTVIAHYPDKRVIMVRSLHGLTI